MIGSFCLAVVTDSAALPVANIRGRYSITDQSQSRSGALLIVGSL